MKGKYGPGEPSDEMMNTILRDVKPLKYNRVIAIGGGTIMDISKLLVLKGVENVTDAFERKISLVKEKQLIIVPATCGTGSEVTNISIAEIKSKKTKMGLADDALMPDDAVLIPELLRGLPFRPYIASAIDALIHAMESYVSPKATPYTQTFSRAAIEIIVDRFMKIAEYGPAYRFERLGDMLIASNFAGIAFGNAGTGAVHAHSYPLGGKYHVPHGESNYQFLTEVFKIYQQKNPTGKIQELNNIFTKNFQWPSEEIYDKLDELLSNLLEKKPLKEYGMTEADITGFAESVIKTQQRLLANNYVELTQKEIENIYRKRY
jgi:4-hydroxybutyrate dehydrogenase